MSKSIKYSLLSCIILINLSSNAMLAPLKQMYQLRIPLSLRLTQAGATITSPVAHTVQTYRGNKLPIISLKTPIQQTIFKQATPKQKDESAQHSKKRSRFYGWGTWGASIAATALIAGYCAGKQWLASNDSEEYLTLENAHDQLCLNNSLVGKDLPDDHDATTWYDALMILCKNIHKTDSNNLFDCIAKMQTCPNFSPDYTQLIEQWCASYVQSTEQFQACALDFLCHASNKETQDVLKLKLEKFFKSDNFVHHNFDHIAQFVIFIQKWEERPSLQECPTPLSPTVCHIMRNLTSSGPSHPFELNVILRYIYNKKSLMLVTHIINREMDYFKRGYATFFHAQTHDWFILLDWYKRLYESHHDIKCPDDFIFPHILPEQSIEKDREERSKILREGLPQGDGAASKDKHVLFTNCSLFANSWGENSAHYLYQNMSIRACEHNKWANRMFSMFSREDLYKQYFKQLENLYTLHKNTFSRYPECNGNLLLIAVPNELVDQVAYTAHPYGFKKEINKSSAGVRQDIETIVNKHNAELFDDTVFCLVTNQDMFNPHSGIKVEQFNILTAREQQKIRRACATTFAQMHRQIKRQDQYDVSSPIFYDIA